MEEGHFTWGQRGPPSTPECEAESVRDVQDEGQIDNVAGCVVGAQEHPEDEPVSEPPVSRPLRSRKRPQWWTDYCICVEVIANSRDDYFVGGG